MYGVTFQKVAVFVVTTVTHSNLRFFAVLLTLAVDGEVPFKLSD
jgi:hypothetical protein